MDIFLHIPKTAGMTLIDLLYRQYEPGAIYWARSDVDVILDEIRDIDASTKDRLELLIGHFAYGVHEYFSQDCRYVTVLREPVERIISNYYYILQEPTHPAHAYVKSTKSLESCVLADTSIYNDNAQTRFLAGGPKGIFPDVPWGACTSELLEKAKQNLEKQFVLAGITEAFDTTLWTMKRLLSWEIFPIYLPKNNTRGKPKQEEIPQTTRDLIRERNRFDIELYEYAKEACEERIRALGSCFFDEVRVFQSMLQAFAAKRQQYGELMGNYEDVLRDLQQLRDDHAAMHNERDLLKNELESIYASETWRIVRAFVRLLRFGKK